MKKLLASVAVVLVCMVSCTGCVTTRPPSIIEHKQIIVAQSVPCNDVEYVLNNYKLLGLKLVFHSDYDKEDNSQIAVFYNRKSEDYVVAKFLTTEAKKDAPERNVICEIASGKAKLDMVPFLTWKTFANK